QDGASGWRNGRLNAGRVDVIGMRVDIDENGGCTAISDAVRSGDERMADGDDFIPGANASSQEGEMQRGGAIGYSAGVWGADTSCELALEGGDFGPLGEPTREDDAANSIGFLFVEKGFCDRDHSFKM